MLLELWIEVSMLEVNEEVRDLLFTHDLLFLVEDFEIMVIKDLIDLVKLINRGC